MYIDQVLLASVTQNANFSLLMHTKHLLLVTFCGTTAGNGPSFRTHRQTDERTDGQIDVKVEIVF